MNVAQLLNKEVKGTPPVSPEYIVGRVFFIHKMRAISLGGNRQLSMEISFDGETPERQLTMKRTKDWDVVYKYITQNKLVKFGPVSLLIDYPALSPVDATDESPA